MNNTVWAPKAAAYERTREITPAELRRTEILNQVLAERARQDEIHPLNCSSPRIDGLAKLPVLVEEVGEVATALLEKQDNLRTELIHVAAVAVAWIESLDQAATTDQGDES